jgi:hypothetical protein
VAYRKHTSVSPEDFEGKHVFIGTRYSVGVWAGQLEFDSQQEQEIFLFSLYQYKEHKTHDQGSGTPNGAQKDCHKIGRTNIA